LGGLKEAINYEDVVRTEEERKIGTDEQLDQNDKFKKHLQFLFR
jgi:hypothetical protein